MTREELIKLISTSKINEKLTNYSVSQLERMNKEQLEEIYEALCDKELNEILNDKL